MAKEKQFHSGTAQDAAVLLCSVSSVCDLLLQVTLPYLKADRFRNTSPVSFLSVQKHVMFRWHKLLAAEFIVLMLWPFLCLVPDDPADSICAPPSSQAFALHLWLKGQIPPAQGPPHAGFPCSWNQKAPGRTRHFPACQCGHSKLRLCPAVWYLDQLGKKCGTVLGEGYIASI